MSATQSLHLDHCHSIAAGLSVTQSQSLYITQVTLSDGSAAGEIPAALTVDMLEDDLTDGFEIRTNRHLYTLVPKARRTPKLQPGL